MSPIREKFIKAIESLPYELEDEIEKRSTLEILKDVTQKYVETYSIEDLSDEDKECINNLIGIEKNRRDNDEG